MSTKGKHHWTVVGIYENSYERFAGFVIAANPEEAERKMVEKSPDLIVAGVIKGWHEMADGKSLEGKS